MKSLETIGGEGRKRRKMDPSLSEEANRKAEMDAKRAIVEGKKNVEKVEETSDSLLEYCFFEDLPHNLAFDIVPEIKKKYSSSMFYIDFTQRSNPYFVTAVNGFLKIFKETQGWRTATPADIGVIILEDKLDLSNCYVDAGLVLRGRENPNEYLAKDLAMQFFGGGTDLGIPSIMVPYADLELEKDDRAPDGLRFKLMRNDRIIYSPTLDNPNESRFSEINGYGLPKESDKDGERILYTKSTGLCNLIFEKGDIISGDAYLGMSLDNGRIVVVRDKETGK